MDPTKLLESDHREVETLFSQIDKAEGGERQRHVDALANALQAHMELEERVVYPVVRSIIGPEEAEEGDTEHQLARKTLAEMVALSPDEPGFGAAMESTKAGIAHHVREEEGEVFPRLRKEGSEALAEMATPFMKLRLELGMPMDAAALTAASSKDELLAEAQEAGLDVSSSMTKEQLAGALAKTMTSG